MAVEHLCRVNINTAAPVMIPGAPQGARMFVGVGGGSFEGDRLRGTIVSGSGGDYVTMRSNGSRHLDVRMVLTTHDGATILVTYNGIGANDADGFGLRTAPLFQTGDERYAWLNDIQAIAVGELTAEGIVYELYALK